MPTNYLTFCEFLQCWRDLSACTPSASSIGSANCRSPAFSELPLRPAKHFSRDLVYSLHHLHLRKSFLCSLGMSHNRRSCLCTNSATGRRVERFALFTRRPETSVTAGSDCSDEVSRMFPFASACRFAQCSDIICSLFFLVTTLSKRRTPRPCTSNAHVAGTLDGAS